MTEGSAAAVIELLAQAHRLFCRALVPLFREEELSFSDVVALKALAAREAESGGGVRLTDLGRAIGFPLSTLTAVVDRLERLGHVERLPSRRDRRSVCVRSTERWQAVSQRLRRRVDAELASFLADLPPERVARLADDLAALVEVLRARLERREVPWQDVPLTREGRGPDASGKRAAPEGEA